ncbi:hypothetical protein OH784_13775 [Ectobacillus funiculus]|uniref:cyclic-phosphate processing receiver domain-containing protein n=1 Tax=Ectobacillus funiculus TaxID=137993 RepID=UPI00397D0599
MSSEKINLYVDDLRDCPKGFQIARNMKEAIYYLQNYQIHILSYIFLLYLTSSASLKFPLTAGGNSYRVSVTVGQNEKMRLELILERVNSKVSVIATSLMRALDDVAKVLGLGLSLAIID